MNVFDVKLSVSYLLQFIQQYHIQKLNFAGPRESGVSGIQQFTQKMVECLIDNIQSLNQ